MCEINFLKKTKWLYSHANKEKDVLPCISLKDTKLLVLSSKWLNIGSYLCFNLKIFTELEQAA